MKISSTRKSMFVAIAALFSMMLASPAVAQLPTTRYGIYIAGTEIILGNCSDLSSIEGVSGTAKYSPITRTLTLTDVTIDGGNKASIVVKSPVKS
ncbi:hypothetical protein [Porphyromonas crevioricanis]|nr:hypothetical protein [Porphyromonas crevioricanis]